MKSWHYKYGENEIEVRNGTAEELYVNGNLQDRKTGITMRSELTGKLPTGEPIKASLGGVFTMQCSLFVDHVFQTPIPNPKKQK